MTGSAVVVAVALLAGCEHATSAHDPESDRQAIERTLRQWPHDFNDRNLPAVCGMFADSVVLAFPDSADRDHRAFCEQMRAVLGDTERHYVYDEPDIREILVDGDLATVRLIWTLTVADASGRVLETTREDGVDVFRRQPDGSWKIHISHAFPL
ncbi:DUF4440 domain-containing protein [Mycobacterium sp. ACS4331]|nr:DUF4440 domain-containing protein [Mycobacterium sp. ACS4331]